MSKKSIFKAATLVLLILVLSVSAVGCGSGEKGASAVNGTEAAGEKPLDVLKLTSPSSSSVSPFFIAEYKGFFKEYGIKPEFVGAVESGKQLSSVVAGKLDVGSGHINRTIAGISNGAKVKAVVASSETSQEYPHMTFAVLKDSPIKTAKDLVGTKHGASAYGGCMEYTPYEYMRVVGKIADPKANLEIVIIPIGQEVQALRQKQVDSIAVSGNAPYVLKSNPDLRLLFTDYDIWGKVGGATHQYFSTDFIKKKPDVVRRYVAAYIKTINWINANREEAVAITAKEFKTDPEKISMLNYAKDGIIEDETVQLWIDALDYYKEIKPGIKAGDIYTNEFNPYYKP